MRHPGGAAGLIGRHAECGVLDRFVAAVGCGGESRALVVHGEAGMGKTALLEYLAGHAPGCRVARAAGVQSEVELPFAGLHQLCAPMLDRLGELPAPQHTALRTAFGLSAGPAPDRFLIGLAALSLLSLAAEERPLVCVVDDQQWLDHASAQALAFAARRLGAEPVGLVFGTRVPGDELAGLPELVVRGLPEADARALLLAVLSGPLDERVRDQLIAETRGNPLALIELPRGRNPAELAGGFGVPGALAGGIEETYRRRVDALPRPARRLLTLAAAVPTGDAGLVWRAAERLGIGADAATGVAELAEIGARIQFRHPLARSAAYRAAAAGERQAAHRALAEVTDPLRDPDRRAWHRAQAAPGPDEDVAAELEASAGRARARGGLAAAAAFLTRAATLTLDPPRRTERALAAAQAELRAGALDAVRDLLGMAEAGPVSDAQQATIDLTRARLAFMTSRGGDAPMLLRKAAERLEPIDAGLSRATYLDALAAAIFAGRLAGPGSGVPAIARAAGAAPPPPGPPRAPDLLLDGLAAQYNEGFAAGVPPVRAALAVFGDGMTVEQELHWLYPVCAMGAIRVWDHERWDALSARHVRLARETGTLSELPLALTSRAFALLFAGELSGVALLAAEIRAIKEATGIGLAPYAEMGLAALRGDEATARELIAATIDDAARCGEGEGITFAEWASAALHNGLGAYDTAAAAAAHACDFDDDLGSLVWATVELVESAVRTGMTAAAVRAYERLDELTGAVGTDYGLGVRARSRALLSKGATAESRYREAIDRLARTRLRVDLARAHLLYGEWLRRERRRLDARERLRTAHGMFDAMGMAAFAERAARELRATGAVAHKRARPARHEELTAQEAQIARLARDGLSNPEIGTRLFISVHTVQYHLRKVFTKLGITSRGQLDRALSGDGARHHR